MSARSIYTRNFLLIYSKILRISIIIRETELINLPPLPTNASSNWNYMLLHEELARIDYLTHQWPSLLVSLTRCFRVRMTEINLFSFSRFSWQPFDTIFIERTIMPLITTITVYYFYTLREKNLFTMWNRKMKRGK